jgi:hypothetical protein
MNEAGTCYQVFVSHSSTDAWVAKQLSTHLERCGAATFLDVNDIEHGDDFDETIVEAAERSHELLVLLTPWSKDRHYVWMEIGMFRGARKRVVGILHGVKTTEIATDERIPVVLKKIDLVDLNAIDSYLTQLARRAAGHNHVRT